MLPLPSALLRAAASRLLMISLCACTLLACTPPPPPGISGEGGKVLPGARCTSSIPLGRQTDTALKDVDFKCCLRIGGDASLSETCSFSNSAGADLRFLYCDRLDLTAGKRSAGPAPQESPKLELFQKGNVIECRDGTVNGGTESSYHLGCELVRLPALGTTRITLHGDTTYVPWSDFDVRVSDFAVSQAQFWNLGDRELSYDHTSCSDVDGQGGWLVPGIDPDVAVWTVSRLPFGAPYVQHQEVGGEVTGEAVQVPFGSGPCVPEELRIPREPFETCRPGTGRGSATSVDLPLYFWRTQKGEGPVPAAIQVETEGAVEAIRVEMEPYARTRIVLEPGRERMGRLRLCAAEVRGRCVAPGLTEGEGVTVRAMFRHADRGDVLFHQEVAFLQDNVPPRVLDLQAEVTEAGLEVAIEAMDDTAGVAHAHVVYSLDGGRSWKFRSFEAETDLMGRGAGRVKLSSTVPVTEKVLEEEGIVWYVVVQDGVFNLTYTNPPQVPGTW